MRLGRVKREGVFPVVGPDGELVAAQWRIVAAQTRNVLGYFARRLEAERWARDRVRVDCSVEPLTDAESEVAGD